MANEYLKRTPTSTGNRKTWTWSGWAKISGVTSADLVTLGAYRTGTSQGDDIFFRVGTGGAVRFTSYNGSSYEADILDNAYKRDNASWVHVMAVANTTAGGTTERWHLYINGSRITDTSNNTYPSDNPETNINNIVQHYIGAPTGGNLGQIFDAYFVDGQALTPDVFGYYKKGDGYISAGSTQATDFKKGQWVPKAPKVIRSVINARGGFGVNGFYLPMNDASNFGADFHCEPNSIIKLKGEDFNEYPQPRNGAPTTTDAYVSQLRTDPYKDYLVVAVPGISGGQGSGYGDYSVDIKGSGTNKTVTANGSAGIAVTASYYGSAMVFDGNGDNFDVASSGDDYLIGQNDFTIEGWHYSVSHASTGHHKRVWYLGGELSDSISLNIHGTDADLEYRYNDGVVLTSGVTIPTGQWVHIALERYNRRTYIYVNGKISANGSDTNYLDYTAYNFRIGQNASTHANGPASSLFGYAQDVRFYNGVAKYKGVGFDIVKPYTPVGIETWRAVPDCTANNFCTLNGVTKPSKYTLSNGNTTFSNSTTNWIGWLEGTVGFSTGKYYWETRVDTGTDYHHIGIVGVGITHFNSSDSYFYGMSYQNDGRFWAEGNTGSAFALSKPQTVTTGDFVQVAVDMGAKKMWIGANGSWIDSGNPAAGTGENFDSTRGFNYDHYVPFYDSYGSSGLSINFGQNPTFSGQTTAGTYTDSNGKGLFKYEPPSGFLALCEDNLPTPAIKNPGEYFKTVLYTGSATSRNIVGIGFTPDLVWLKSRSGNFSNFLFDSVRGSSNNLFSNATDVEASATNRVLSFDSDGFSLGDAGGSVNGDGENIVAWCWRAGAGTTTANTDGTIPSVVSVNQDAGFSIVSYTGNATESTVGHGLNKTPGFIIVKKRNGASDWPVYHQSLATQEYLVLNLTAGKNTTTELWYQDPTSSVFYIGDASNAINASGGTYIAYCWAEVEGFSKFGSYVGNGSADGPFMYCGFKPAWIIFKRSDTSGSWVIKDSSRKSTNPQNSDIFANTSDVESDIFDCDFLSNGFKLRDTTANNSGGTYIFAAFAESSFTTANAK